MLIRECLTEAELSAYQLGMLPPGQSDEVAEHLQECSGCSAAVARLDELADGVIAALRQFPLSDGMGTYRPMTLSQDRQPGFDTSCLHPQGAAAPPLPRFLAGYQIMEELGRGGMGIVYKAHQVKLNRMVALKMVLAGAHARPVDLTRFLVEGEMVARLDHPNIVRAYEVGTHEGQPFLALEYVPGGTLASRLDGKPWPARQAAAVLESLARATDHAHRLGIVHRDLKPANILLAADGTPRITDFGLAKLFEGGAGLTTTGAVVGTPNYMAPEQAEGDGSRVGPLADVFALGVILYEMLSGQRPFQGDNPVEVLLSVVTQEPRPLSRVRPGLPRDLCTICQRCLEKNPQRRYASAGALADDLQRFQSGEPIHARPVGEIERAWKWARRRPAVAGLLVAVVLSLVAGTVTSAWLGLVARGSANEARDARKDAEDRAIEKEIEAEKADKASAAATIAREEAESLAARLTFRVGLAEADAGRIDHGLLLMLQALQRARSDPSLQRVVRANLAAYAERLPVMREFLKGYRGSFLDPDGTLFVTVTPENRLQRWDTRTGRKVGAATSPALPGTVRTLSGDGRWALTVVDIQKKPQLRLVDVSTGKLIDAALGDGYASYTSYGFAPGIDVVWVTETSRPDDGMTTKSWLYQTKTGKPVGAMFREDFRLFRSRGRTIWMTFPHPDSGKASSPAVATARFKDLDTGKSLQGCAPDVRAGDGTVRFDGRDIVTLGRDGLIRWWSPITGKETQKPWWPAPASQQGPGALLAGGRTLVIRRTDGRLGWFDLLSRQEHPVSLPCPPNAEMAVHPDGTALLLGLADQPLRLWRVESLPPPAIRPEGAEKFIKVAYSPDRRLVYTTTVASRKTAYGVVTEVATGRPISQVSLPTLYGPVFSPDSRRLATCSAALPGHPPGVRLWEINSGRQIGSLHFQGYIQSLLFSPDNRHLAVGVIGKTYLWDPQAKTRQELAQSAPVSELLFSPDGKWLATGSRSGWGEKHPSTFSVWETATSRPIGKAIPTSDAARFAFSLDSKILFTLELAGGILRRWEVAKGLKQVGVTHSLHRETQASHAVFSADAKRLLTGYPEGRVLQWDTATGKQVGDVMSHPTPVTALAMSPDGRHLAIGCEDGSAWLRDIATGLPLGPPVIHRAAIKGLAFGAPGDTLLSTSGDGVTITTTVPLPLEQNLDALATWLETITGTRLKGEEVGVLALQQREQARHHLEKVWPAAAVEIARSTRLGPWHRDRSRQAEASGRGCLWELGQLIEVEGAVTPKNWLTRARRARLRLSLNQMEAADEDYRLVASVAAEPLAAWYRYCATDALYDHDLLLAHEYLNRLIAMVPESEHRLYAQRAEVRATLGKKAEARADYWMAVKRGAAPGILMLLVDELASEGSWLEASKYLVEAERRLGGSLGLWQRQAMIHLKLGDTAAYRSLCERALQWHQRLPKGKIELNQAIGVCFLCTLGPDGIAKWDGLLDLSSQLEEILAKSQASPGQKNVDARLSYTIPCCRMAVLFRAGKYAEALTRLKPLLKANSEENRALHWPLLALIQGKLRQSTEARDALAKAQGWLDNHPMAKTPWFSRLMVQLLTNEARQFLAEKTPEK